MEEIGAILAAAVEKLRTAGIEQPLMEAQLLLAHVMGIERTKVIAGTHSEPTWKNISRFHGLIRRREAREPLAYLRGTQEFYGMSFVVGPEVLIPRPETELLVEAVLTEVGSSSYISTPSLPPPNLGGGVAGATPVTNQPLRPLSEGTPFPTLIDIGTGSGCIAIACAKHIPNLQVLATDTSRDAIRIAKYNAASYDLDDQITFSHTDLLTNIPSSFAEIIVSNPPYISSDELPKLMPEVAEFEPKCALTPGPDGLAIYRRLVEDAPRVLKSNGLLAVEVGMGQASEVAEMFRNRGFAEVTVVCDLAGIERVVRGRRPEE